jgi:hypothetical protein
MTESDRKTPRPYLRSPPLPRNVEELAQHVLRLPDTKGRKTIRAQKKQWAHEVLAEQRREQLPVIKEDK